MASRQSVIVAALVASLVVVGAAACTGAPTPSASARPTTSTPPDSTAAPSHPTLDVGGTAQDNLAYFDYVNTTLIAKTANPDGRTVIDNLVAAGFTKADMQVTEDKTTVGLAADNIQFSVKIDGQCLIGQSGNVGYHSVVAAPISTGQCLIGNTRPINW